MKTPQVDVSEEKRSLGDDSITYSIRLTNLMSVASRDGFIDIFDQIKDKIINKAVDEIWSKKSEEIFASIDVEKIGNAAQARIALNKLNIGS